MRRSVLTASGLLTSRLARGGCLTRIWAMPSRRSLWLRWMARSRGWCGCRRWSGLRCLKCPRCGRGRYAMVQELVVARSHQRRGIGTRLMREAERWARDRGLTQIELGVYEFNEAALRLYSKLGYSTDLRRLSRTLKSQATFAGDG